MCALCEYLAQNQPNSNEAAAKQACQCISCKVFVTTFMVTFAVRHSRAWLRSQSPSASPLPVPRRRLLQSTHEEVATDPRKKAPNARFKLRVVFAGLWCGNALAKTKSMDRYKVCITPEHKYNNKRLFSPSWSMSLEVQLPLPPPSLMIPHFAIQPMGNNKWHVMVSRAELCRVHLQLRILKREPGYRLKRRESTSVRWATRC